MYFHKTKQELGKVYEPGEIVFRQGDPPGAVYVILEGQVEISIARAEDQPSICLAVLERDHVFGEMSLLDQQPRVATAKAISRVRLLSLDQKGFLQRLHEDPALSLRIMLKLSERIRHMISEIIYLHARIGLTGPLRFPWEPVTLPFFDTLQRMTVDLLFHPTEVFTWARGQSLLAWSICLQMFRWWATSITTMVNLHVSDTPMLLPVPMSFTPFIYRYFEIFAYGPYGLLIISTIALFLWRYGRAYATVKSMTFAKSWEMVGLAFFTPWLPTLLIDNLLIQYGIGGPEIMVPWHIVVVVVESWLVYVGLRAVFGIAQKQAWRLALGGCAVFLVMAGLLIR
ncbi:MAG: cyclic nucleotide-binding domain-containing protein [Magnetococcales bacterium]|nr:cyclic nucleotide-binding domain-containing protein [Magnetococcales bacterium]